MAVLRRLTSTFGTLAGLLFLSATLAGCEGCGKVTSVGTGEKPETPTIKCPATFTACGVACMNLATDFSACGKCGQACAAGKVCSLGKCVDDCDPGLTDCAGSCIDTATDGRHCGECSTACTNGQICSETTCAEPAANCKTDPKPEVCDGDDNDCDDSIDETCDCVDGKEMDCGITLGACRAGVQRCKGGSWGRCEDLDADTPYVAPSQEECNREDDDCDGDIDEGCECTDDSTLECGSDTGLCQQGIQTCIAGRWGNCEGDVTPAQEDCDGEDNDCDGDVDEGCDCVNGSEQDCGTTLGACEPGVQRCSGGKWGRCEDISADEPHVDPAQEDCDGEDNDCDGDIDEGCDCLDGAMVACGSDLGMCERGEQHCTVGHWSSCEGGVDPAQEDCDGTDNDCDGDVDEGCDCQDGNEQECGTTLGACEPGLQRCDSGRWGRCADISVDLPHIEPAQEECDGADNDCDGDVDEGCDCQNGAEQECGSSVGACATGTQVCVHGSWSSCQGSTGPEREDCDGEDNDCDGDIDEGCDCQNGGQRECGSALGACEVGVQHCLNGKWGDCVGDLGPASEACDGEDNDCDGDIDEGCDCSEGQTRWCQAGSGRCSSGQQACLHGSWGVCEPASEPVDELCDGIDNDCDGEIDNGFDLTVACPTGGCPQRRSCSADKLSSVCADDARLLGPERCDGVDNDCNGLVDRISEGGTVRSICDCESRTVGIGRAVDSSIPTKVNLCDPTQCGGDKPRGLLFDGICWPACETPSDPDGDGWGFENGHSCLREDSSNGQAASPCGGVPIGMSMTYCLDCVAPLPYAMCTSLPQFDLRAFGRGEVWLKVDYTYTSAGNARVPLNLWVSTPQGQRMRLPLVAVSDIPRRNQKTFRVDEACFTPTASFGGGCTPEAAPSCDHCGAEERCGATGACGDYDLSQAWLQIAAEWCEPNIGVQSGNLTIHSVDAVEPNCGHD